MTEREKMLAGLQYDCGDPELLDRWHEAKALTLAYNQTDPRDAAALRALLARLLGGMGRNLWITAPFFVDYGNNIYFADNCEVNMNCTFQDCARITVGKNALIGPNVQIYTAFHPTSAAERRGAPNGSEFPFAVGYTAPVTIGDDVWLGGGVILLPGVTIGDNVVIGAGSVVTRSIPSNTVAAGNPCRVLRPNG